MDMSWLSPQLVSSLVQLGPALFQGRTARKQAEEAEEMQKALGPRVAYGIPEEAKKALGIAEDIARPREMAGQTYMQYMIDQETAKTAGKASRGATNAQDLLSVITQLGEAGQEGQLKLGMAAAEDYNKRQQILQSALGNMATYKDKVTADKQLDWNQRAAAAAAMKGASMQNRMGGLQGMTRAAMQFLGSDAAAQLFGNIGARERSRQQTLDKIDDMNALSSDGEEGVIDPAGYTPPGMTDKQMLDVTGMTPAPASGYFSADSIPGMGMQTQLPVNDTGLMPMTYRNAFQQIPTMSGMQGTLPVNETGLMPMTYRNAFQQTPNINSIQGMFPANQTGLMPTTSMKDLFNFMYSYPGIK
jgi:hypothetical protein